MSARAYAGYGTAGPRRVARPVTGSPAGAKTATKKTLLLDLDETLISMRDGQVSSNVTHHHLCPADFLANGDEINLTMIVRPGTEDFVLWASSFFDYVVIWSAAELRYVNACVARIWAGMKAPTIIWSELHCAGTVTVPIKATKVLRESYPAVDFGDIIRIDDREDVVPKVDKEYLILIPEFRPDDPAAVEDDALPKIRQWIENNVGRWHEDKRGIWESSSRTSRAAAVPARAARTTP